MPKAEVVAMPAPTETRVARLDVHALIATAVQTGAPIETLERLVALAKEMQSMVAKEAYLRAMAEFRAKCPKIKKKSEGTIGTRKYKYSDLADLETIIVPVMAPLGLSHSWRTRDEGNKVYANCLIAHEQGHAEESGWLGMTVSPAGASNPNQQTGSALTYAKRYTFCAITGVTPEDDDDDAKSSHDDEAPKRAAQRYADLDKSDRAALQQQQAAAEPDVKDLLPTPEEDAERQQLLSEGQRLAKKLGRPLIDDAKKTYLGSKDADPVSCDLGALNDLVKFLKSRANE